MAAVSYEMFTVSYEKITVSYEKSNIPYEKTVVSHGSRFGMDCVPVSRDHPGTQGTLKAGNSVANALNLFIRTNQFREQNYYSNSMTVKVGPTDSTRELITHVLGLLRAIYRPGFGYRKSGVILLDLQPAAGETKRLFDDEGYLRDRRLMSAVDMLNAKHGRRTLHFGAVHGRARNWHMNRNHLSRAFTTDIEQVVSVVL